MNRPADMGGGGTVVQINIAEFRGLITGLEQAEEDLGGAESGARDSLSRLWLSAEGLGGLHSVRAWITDSMPELRRRLAKAEELSQSSPGLPNSVTFTEESLSDLTPAQARAQARVAAGLLNADPDSVHELSSMLSLYGDDPYFAHEFASLTSPRDYATLISDLTRYESLPGYLTPEAYEGLLTNLAGTLGLASRGTGELAMPQSWQDDFVEMMTSPSLHGDDQNAIDRMDTDRDNMPALWLLLARGHWSTGFLEQTTATLARLDKSGYLWFPPAAGFIATSPNGERFMDPMVALMGALVNNPEAAHWAFTAGGTTDMPFPKDGEDVTGPVQTFLHDLFTDHRWTDEDNGPKTVLLAMRAALLWKNDPSIVASAENLKKSMEQQQEVWDEKPWYAKWGHTVLDVLGLIPLVGDPADAINAGWYGLEGDWVNAGLSAAALIPLAGTVVGAGKLFSRGSKLAEILRMADKFGNVIDETSDVGRILSKSIKVEDGVYTFTDAKSLQKALLTKQANMEYRSRELAFVTDASGEVSQLKVFVGGSWVPVDSSKLGLKLSGLKAGHSPWDMIGLPRGEVIESALAKTHYASYENVGKLRGGYYPTIDFYKNGKAVSLKTMDPPNAGGVRSIKSNIDKLLEMKSSGVTIDGRRVKDASLDLRVRIGKENDALVDELREYAADQGVKLDVYTY